MLNRRLVDRFSLRNLLRIATSCALAFALLLLLFNIGNFRSLWAVVFPMLLIFSTNGIVAACSNAAALNSAEDSMTGSAAALPSQKYERLTSHHRGTSGSLSDLSVPSAASCRRHSSPYRTAHRASSHRRKESRR